MADGFKEAGGVTWAELAAGAAENFTIDYVDDLTPGDTITGSTWSGAGLTFTGQGIDGTAVNVRIGGSDAGKWYDVTNLVTTADGDTLVKDFRLYSRAGTSLDTDLPSIFNTGGASIRDAIASLRRDRLALALRRLSPRAEISDESLLEKLLAAEAQVSRDLRVWLTPREVLPWSASADEIQALQDAGKVVEFEPGYDYSPEFYDGNSWGRLDLRQVAVIEVHKIEFVYPSLGQTLYAIPNEWIRVDRKYGAISLVPTNATIVLPLNNYILTVLGGGRTIPLMIQVRYSAGLQNAARDYPDLVDIIKKSAVLRLVDDMLLPTSGSTSADGLSQSLSWDADKYREAIEKKLEGLRQAIQGVRVMVL